MNARIGSLSRTAGPQQARKVWGTRLSGLVSWSVNPIIGMTALLAIWWVGGWLIRSDPNISSFSGFAPGPTLSALADLVRSGRLWDITAPSLYRLGMGLLWAAVLGVPFGVAVGLSTRTRRITHVPFQFLRMISPLAWMPVAVLAFPTWNGAIIFLIAVAAVWPVLFSTAQGVRRIDPLWFKVARNLGGDGFQRLFRIVLPAIGQDVFAGIRLAVGVGWIVLVPAEYLGVTSGLGYAISDARDTLDYSHLTAIVVVIGILGFLIDAVCVSLIRKFSWHNET